jgi:hypothetical protein
MGETQEMALTVAAARIKLRRCMDGTSIRV